MAVVKNTAVCKSQAMAEVLGMTLNCLVRNRAVWQLYWKGRRKLCGG